MILNPEVELYLRDNIDMNPSEVALRKSPFQEVRGPELAEQLTGLQIARKKIPSWYVQEGLYYPARQAMEQCSSEETAEFKASRMDRIEGLWDLSGGAGIDTFFLGRSASRVEYVETEPERFQRTMHNLHRLGLNALNGTNAGALQFLADHKGETDLAYLDPDRRVVDGRRSVLWRDCRPLLSECLPLLEGRVNRVLIKGSPLLDLRRGTEDLHAHASSLGINRILIVAEGNEIKELLFLLRPGPQPPFEHVDIEAWELRSGNRLHVLFRPADETLSKLDGSLSFSERIAGDYLYEPHNTLLKGGLFHYLARRYKLQKLAANTHLYQGEQVEGFPGKRFHILDAYAPGSARLKEWKNCPVRIASRNYPLNAQEIRKKYRLRQGGETYLFFTRLNSDLPVVIEALRDDHWSF